MVKVLVSYFSFTGKTKQLAEAAAESATQAGASVEIKEVTYTTVQDVNAADAWLVATPQTFGTMAAETKRMFERLWIAKGEMTNKPAFGAVICHANEPVATMELMMKFATLFGLTVAHDTLSVNVAQLEDSLPACRRLGLTLSKATG